MQVLNPIVKTLLIIIFSLGTVFGLVGLYNHLITKNISTSEPIGYYLKLPVGDIKAGQRYLLCLDDEKYMAVLKKLGLINIKGECPQQFPYLIKQIVGVPSDTVEITHEGVLINGVLQPNSKGFTQGRGINLYPLPVSFKYKLKPTEYFVLGITSTSVDSRYFGVIKRSQMFKRAILLMNDN